MGKQTTKDDSTKAAAQSLLRRGLATYSEIAELSGRSRQIVRHWAQEHPDARAEYLRRIWAKEMAKRAPK